MAEASESAGLANLGYWLEIVVPGVSMLARLGLRSHLLCPPQLKVCSVRLVPGTRAANAVMAHVSVPTMCPTLVLTIVAHLRGMGPKCVISRKAGLAFYLPNITNLPMSRWMGKSKTVGTGAAASRSFAAKIIRSASPVRTHSLSFASNDKAVTPSRGSAMQVAFTSISS